MTWIRADVDVIPVGVVSVLTSLVFLTVAPFQVGAESREFCQSEYFNVTCRRGEVALIKRAFYGRMETGRCLTGSFGGLGCAEDVKPYLDWQCGGRRRCQVYIADPTLHKLQACPKGLASYLQADATCMPVVSHSECLRNRIIFTKGSSGYISSVQTAEFGIGTCPYVIKSSEGQRFKISIIGFGGGKIGEKYEVQKTGSRQDICYEVGAITEGDTRKIITNCGSHGERQSAIYESYSSEVSVKLLSKEVIKGLAPFLIKYEAIGCPRLEAPVGGWVSVEADKDKAVIRCNDTDETWYVTCSGTEWKGQMGECRQESAAPPDTWSLGQALQSGQKFPYGILIVVAIGVALGVFFGGVILSIVAIYMKRKQRSKDPIVPSRDVEDIYHDATLKSTTYSLGGSAIRREVGRVGVGVGVDVGGMHYTDIAPERHGSVDGDEHVPRSGAVAFRDGMFHSYTQQGQRGPHLYESPQFS